MNVISQVIDRVVLVAGVLIGGALQSFIIQYRQRLGGHLDQALIDLSRFQEIADKYHEGNLDALISSYLEHGKASVHETGIAVKAIETSSHSLQMAFDGLNGNAFEQLWSMFRYSHPDILGATWKSFEPAFSFSQDALIMAGLMGMLLWSTYYCLTWLTSHSLQSLKTHS